MQINFWKFHTVSRNHKRGKYFTNFRLVKNFMMSMTMFTSVINVVRVLSQSEVSKLFTYFAKGQNLKAFISLGGENGCE